MPSFDTNDPKVGEIQRFPVAINLSTIPREPGGKINKGPKVNMMDALLRSIIDITWNQNAPSCVGPVVKFRLEPKRLLCDLLAMQEEPATAAIWRNQTFNSMAFRENVMRSLAKAVAAWEQGEYDQAFVADDKGNRVMAAQAASDVRPRG